MPCYYTFGCIIGHTKKAESEATLRAPTQGELSKDNTFFITSFGRSKKSIIFAPKFV